MEVKTNLKINLNFKYSSL